MMYVDHDDLSDPSDNLRINCIQECRDQQGCNNNYCRINDPSFTEYCNPCEYIGLNSQECLNNTQYMDDYCEENENICIDYCYNNDVVPPYAVNPVCEHDYCSSDCNICSVSMTAVGCNTLEYCYRDNNYVLCKNNCLSHVNYLCDDSIDICRDLRENNKCMFNVCHDEMECSLSEFDGLTSDNVYYLKNSHSERYLSYNVILLEDRPEEVQLINSETVIETTTGLDGKNRWIVRDLGDNLGVLISYAYPTHWLDTDASVSFGGYTSTNERLRESTQHQIEFVPVRYAVNSEIYFLLKKPETNLFMMMSDKCEFREMNNIDDSLKFMWSFDMPFKQKGLINYPSMLDPNEILTYFRGSKLKSEKYRNKAFRCDAENRFYLDDIKNTPQYYDWGANKHITYKHTYPLGTMEAWTSLFLTYSTVKYIKAGVDDIRESFIETSDDENRFEENSYYILFDQVSPYFKIVSMNTYFGSHRYVGLSESGIEGAWVPKINALWLYFDDVAKNTRDTMFYQDIVALGDLNGVIYLSTCMESSWDDVCCGGIPCPSQPSIPQFYEYTENSKIRLLGNNLTFSLGDDYTMKMDTLNKYVSIGDQAEGERACSILDDKSVKNILWLAFDEEAENASMFCNSAYNSVSTKRSYYGELYYISTNGRSIIMCNKYLCCFYPPGLIEGLKGVPLKFRDVSLRYKNYFSGSVETPAGITLESVCS